FPGSEFVEKNRDLWDKRVRGHLREGLYPSAAVEAGTYTVGLPDRIDVGEVGGRRLLHLQCNAGADTLYWARRGASVVGVDFSMEAIAEAQRLAAVTGTDAEFVCSDIYALRAVGLRIDYLREHPTTGFRMLPSFERDGDRRWTTATGTPRVPLTFSLRASR